MESVKSFIVVFYAVVLFFSVFLLLALFLLRQLCFSTNFSRQRNAPTVQKR